MPRDDSKDKNAPVTTERTEADRVAQGTGYGGPAAVAGGITNPAGDAAGVAPADDPEALRAQVAALQARLAAAEADAKKSARRRRGHHYVALHGLAIAKAGPTRGDAPVRRDIAAGEEFDATAEELAGLKEGVDYE